LDDRNQKKDSDEIVLRTEDKAKMPSISWSGSPSSLGVEWPEEMKKSPKNVFPEWKLF
jgi:hypothetical protein